MRRYVQPPNARAEEETSPPPAPVQIVWNNERPSEEHKGVEFERYTEATDSPVSTHPPRQYQAELEPPKQFGSSGRAEAMNREERESDRKDRREHNQRDQRLRETQRAGSRP